uniref:HDC16923 n=1 Tax=Drosophila melanogaster TaxID=7227 RepID=Q6IIU6_DROME|nr:TPA_inf: HDC16923 [Drosophila melanogaster]
MSNTLGFGYFERKRSPPADLARTGGASSPGFFRSLAVFCCPLPIHYWVGLLWHLVQVCFLSIISCVRVLHIGQPVTEAELENRRKTTNEKQAAPAVWTLATADPRKSIEINIRLHAELNGGNRCGLMVDLLHCNQNVSAEVDELKRGNGLCALKRASLCWPGLWTRLLLLWEKLRLLFFGVGPLEYRTHTHVGR